MTGLQAMLVLAGSLVAAGLPADFALPPPPGPFVGAVAKDSESRSRFLPGTPLIATTYFYWYDDATKSHIVDHDGTDALTDHPRTLEGFSYKNIDWHARELTDMMAAGVDVVLPVYWGTPHTTETWSDEGLPKLVAARERLLAAGSEPPAIGMFYDTSTLAHNGKYGPIDLTTPAGHDWFYGTIRNFFSLIPPKHRVLIDGKPLVLLYAPAFASRVDSTLFPAVRRKFRADFGTDLYLVKMRGWPGEADSEYQWGAALAPQILDTAGIGPGYDHSAVPGRSPLVRDRDGGDFYRFGWQRLLALDPATRPWLVHLETWNEFHEGTEICETAEYGRQYIELTREFADAFHARRQVDAAAGLNRLEAVSAVPGKTNGIELVASADGDGPVEEKVVAGRLAWTTTKNRHSPERRYMYFDVDYRFLYDGDEQVVVAVDYFDAGPESFEIQYDSSDPALHGIAQQFHPGRVQTIGQTKTWKTAVFVLPRARFANRANGGDFRLSCGGAELSVGRVVVTRANPNSGERR